MKSARSNKSTPSWTRGWPACVALATMLALTGCCGQRHRQSGYAHNAQPSYLVLAADETYTAPRAETWVSPAVLQEKDSLISALTEVLARFGVDPYLPK